jgi:hypothetical protein
MYEHYDDMNAIWKDLLVIDAKIPSTLYSNQTLLVRVIVYRCWM